MSEDKDDLLSDGIAQLTEGMREQARQEFWTHYWPRRVLPITLALILVMGSLVAVVVVGLYGRQSATEAAVTALRLQAEQSKQQGDQANAQLQQRGQQPVPIPQPGSAADMDVIVAAATAKVLASLPDLHPSAAQLGQAVAQFVAANPLGPTPAQISASIAGYLATHPLPSGAPGPSGAAGATGEQGPSGKPGPPPTEAEIQQAFGDYIAAHPDALCVKGGVFTEVRVALADGSAADSWICVVQTYPPSTKPKPTLIPTPTVKEHP